jgi:general secretion pathway protein A
MLADERSFGLTADPKYLYKSHSHLKAVETLQQAIARRDCFAVVTGEPGTGKTTLCRALADNGRNVLTVLLLHPPSTPDELVAVTLRSFGLLSREHAAAADVPPTQEMVNTLEDFLRSIHGLGATAALIVDEAQLVPAAVLQQVRTLANLTVRKDNLLQVVLVGQPPLLDTLAAPDLQHLDKRLALRCELEPLSEQETGEYVSHRLQIADPHGATTFAPDALARVHLYSQGIPRLVNLICHRALIAAQGNRSSVVDAEMVTTAAERLELKSGPQERGGRSWFGRFKRR